MAPSVFVKTHRTVYLKRVNATICKLYLNDSFLKVISKKSKWNLVPFVKERKFKLIFSGEENGMGIRRHLFFCTTWSFWDVLLLFYLMENFGFPLFKTHENDWYQLVPLFANTEATSVCGAKKMCFGASVGCIFIISSWLNMAKLSSKNYYGFCELVCHI